MKHIEIAGVGSAIADYLYDSINFESDTFQKYVSRSPGDGGLEPGKLVLTDDFKDFAMNAAGVTIDEATFELVGGVPPTSFNLGGPTIAALINTAQMLDGYDATVRFYAANGNDEAGSRIRDIIERTPVDASCFTDYECSSPYTIVLSDPAYSDGAGERTFLNNIGSSHRIRPDILDDRFYQADIRLYGGTALVPPIHRVLTSLLKKSFHPVRLNVVAAVYDFANEKKHPDRHWPLGESDESYRYIDLLTMDAEEALRLSGTDSLDSAKQVFKDRGLKAFLLTCGTDDVYVYSDGSRFSAIETYVPISRTNAEERGDVVWDTTGCGDNFAGAVLYSLGRQLTEGRGQLDLLDACTWGVCAGDFACYFIGGTYLESRRGERFERINEIHRRYEELYRG